MDPAPEQAHDDVRRLQGCINDLIGIQTLSSNWSRVEAPQIVNTLLEALISVLRLDFACARVNESGADPAIEAVRFPPAQKALAQAALSRTCEALLRRSLPLEPVAIPNPMGQGEIRIAPVRLGLQDEIGVLVLASERTGFPTELETIIMRVAGNQAVIALQEARAVKRGEERLRRSEAQLAEGQKLSHSGSWSWNVSSGELVFSDESFRILGFDPEQPSPSLRTALDRIHTDDREAVVRILEGAIQDKKDFEFEARAALPEGSIRHVHCVGRPFIHDSGALEFIGTLLDITERKRAEETVEIAQAQLAHMSRVTTMGELAASIAHEVNQPLAAVITNGSACLRWLAGSEPNVDEARAAAARIVAEANRASQVLARIRALMKKAEPSTMAVNLNELIHEVLALTRHQILRDGVSVRCELAPDLHAVQGDPVQLQQVALNLIVNATEAMRATPAALRQLRVSTENVGSDQILVSVRDWGVGIDPRTGEDMFKPFVSSKVGGLGMGLAISRSIIEAHGGRLWAAANPDQGATFRFSLPSTSA